MDGRSPGLGGSLRSPTDDRTATMNKRTKRKGVTGPKTLRSSFSDLKINDDPMSRMIYVSVTYIDHGFFRFLACAIILPMFVTEPGGFFKVMVHRDKDVSWKDTRTAD